MRTIPSYSNITDPQARAVIAALVENVETLSGQRGRPGATSRAVTVKDLVSAGGYDTASKGVLTRTESSQESADDKFQQWLESKSSGGASLPRVFSHTEDYDISANDAGSIHHNADAPGRIVLTLPPATPGMTFLFIRGKQAGTDAYHLRVRVSAGDTMWGIATVSSTRTNPQLRFKSSRAMMRLTCHIAGEWAIESQQGTFDYI
jgi:hypothetical protein